MGVAAFRQVDTGNALCPLPPKTHCPRVSAFCFQGGSGGQTQRYSHRRYAHQCGICQKSRRQGTLLPGAVERKRSHEKRKLSQPIEFYNSGSIFKKVQGESAGKIIDNLGLKNVKIGGAQVSGLHANFIINKGNATSQDVIALIEKLKAEVFDKTGKKLEEEVIVVGD